LAQVTVTLPGNPVAEEIARHEQSDDEKHADQEQSNNPFFHASPPQKAITGETENGLNYRRNAGGCQ
jgi:hypothetical protein